MSPQETTVVKSPQGNRDPFNTERPVVYRLNLLRKLVFYPVACLLRLYFLTLRLRMDPAERKLLAATARPRMVVMWHNRSLLAMEVLRRLLDPEHTAILVSPSKMAAWEVAMFEFANFKVIRGSTTRRSIQAGMEILRAFRNGDDIGLSPDGPSGPLYSFQPGAVALARRANVPMLLIVPNCRRARRLRTWDRHLVPFPFASVRIRIKIIRVDDPLWRKSEVAEEIRRVCLEMTEDWF